MRSSIWSATQPGSSKTAWLLIATAAVSIALLFLVSQSVTRTGSAPAHVGAEIISSALAFFASIALLGRYSISKERNLLLLGSGFLGASVLNLFHAVVSDTTVADSFASQNSVIALTGLSSSLFLGSLALLAAVTLKKPSVTSRLNACNVAIGSTVAIVSIAANSVLVTAPEAIVTTQYFVRPLDLLVGLVLLSAFVGFAMQGIGGISSFRPWVAISLLAMAMMQMLFMSLSAQPLDASDSSAHMLKLIAYALVGIGVSVDAHRAHQREKTISAELGRVNDALNQRNLDLTSARNDLDALTRLAKIASSSVNVSDDFDEFAKELKKRVQADRILVVTASDDLLVCRVEAVWGHKFESRDTGDQLPTTGRLMGETLRSTKTMVFNEISIKHALKKDNRLQVDIDAGFRSWLSTPVIARGRVIGALLLRSRKPNAYGPREVSFLEQVASQIAGPIDVSRQLKEFVDSTSFRKIA